MNNCVKSNSLNRKILFFRNNCSLEIIYYSIFLAKILTDWLTKSSEADINNGKGQAYCKLCKVNLRAHKADLNKHKGTNMHIAREKLLPKNLRQQMQPILSNFGR